MASLISYLGKRAKQVVDQASRLYDQVNVLDNGLSYETRKIDPRNAKRSALQQAAPIAKGVVKAPAQMLNTAVAQVPQVDYSIRQALAAATNNTPAYKNATRNLEAANSMFNQNSGGLFNAGTFYGSEDAKRGDLKTGLTKIGGGTLQTATTVAPFTKGGSFAIKGSLKKTVPKLALEGAAYNSVLNIGQQLQEKGTVDADEVRNSAIVGAAVGGALPVAVKGVQASAPAVKAGAKKSATIVKDADQKAFNTRVSVNDQRTLADLSNHFTGVQLLTGRALSDTLRKSQEIATKSGVDITSGPYATRLEGVNQLLQNVNRPRTDVGSIKNPFYQDNTPDINPADIQAARVFDENPMATTRPDLEVNAVDLPEIPSQRSLSQAQLQLPRTAVGPNTPTTSSSLPEFNTKKVGNLDKAFRSNRSIIERQGPSGQQLAAKLQASRDTEELFLADLQQQMPTVTKLARKERNRLRPGGDFENFVEATQGKATPNNPTVAQAIKEWQTTHPAIRERAVGAGLDVGDLGPQYYPHFLDYDALFKDKNRYNEAINHLVSSGQAESPEAAIKLLGYARDVSRNREFGNLEASRLVDLPDYDKTPNSLVSYLSGSAKRISNTETFGAKDDEALKLITKIGEEGGDTEAAKNAYDISVGARNYNPTTERVSRGIRKYTTTTRLGLGALTNVSQSVNTGIVTGHTRTLLSGIKQLDPKTRQFAQDAGVISDALLSELRNQQGYQSFSSKVFGKAVNKVTAPGFGLVEKFNRSVAATAGRDYGLRLAQKGDEAALRKLGVTGPINGKTLTEAQQIQVARKVVEKTQFKVDPQDLPGWADSPGGKLVAQFRTFSYNQSKFFSNEILKPATKGNLLPLTRMLVALPLGYGLYETRRIIDGRPEEENSTKEALASFSKIGGAGLIFDLYQSLNPVGSKYIPSDRRTSMASGAVGGPSVGTATQAVGALSEFIQRKNTPEDESRLDGKLALAKGETYTDATPAARFGLQQIPILGTPIKNRLLPFKKESDADTGKLALTKDQQEQYNSLLQAEDLNPGQAQKFLDNIVKKSEDKNSTAVDRLAATKKAKNTALKTSLSPEDYKLSKLSKTDREKLIASGAYSKKKFEGLDGYVKGKKNQLGITTANSSTSNQSPKQKYEAALKKFKENESNMSEVAKYATQKSLDKMKIQAPFPDDVIKLHSMSKEKAHDFLVSAKDGQKLADQLIAYDKALNDAGQSKYRKFANGIAPAKKGRRRTTARKGRKGSGYSKVANATALSGARRVKQIKTKAPPKSTAFKVPTQKKTALKSYTVTKSSLSKTG